MSVEDSSLGDVIDEAQDIIRKVEALPTHVRPWFRGIEAEAERVWLEVDVVRNRSASRFLTWTIRGLSSEEVPRG